MRQVIGLFKRLPNKGTRKIHCTRILDPLGLADGLRLHDIISKHKANATEMSPNELLQLTAVADNIPQLSDEPWPWQIRNMIIARYFLFRQGRKISDKNQKNINSLLFYLQDINELISQKHPRQEVKPSRKPMLAEPIDLQLQLCTYLQLADPTQSDVCFFPLITELLALDVHAQDMTNELITNEDINIVDMYMSLNSLLNQGNDFVDDAYVLLLIKELLENHSHNTHQSNELHALIIDALIALKKEIINITAQRELNGTESQLLIKLEDILRAEIEKPFPPTLTNS